MSSRDFRLYLQDIIDSGEAIQDFVKDYSEDEFIGDRKTYSAVIREFEIIGEAVGKLPEDIREEYPQVPWRDIKDFRNLLIHEYFGVDLELIWQVICDELPLLLDVIYEIMRNIVPDTQK